MANVVWAPQPKQKRFMERNIQGTDSAALLVSVIDMQELLSAYPSYFMNAKEFIDSLAEFVGKCKLEGYIA